MEYKWIFCSSAVVMRYNVCYFALFSYFVSFFFIMPVMFVTSKPKYNNIPHSVHFFFAARLACMRMYFFWFYQNYENISFSLYIDGLICGTFQETNM